MSGNECAVCGPGVTHQPDMKHPYSPKGSSVAWLGTRQRGNDAQRGAERPSVTVVGDRWPFDPVLRQALIDKGVLTPQDLTDAEAKIRAVSAMFGGSGHGQPTEEARGRQVQE